MPERDREVYLRHAGPFSLSAAIGERRSSDSSPENSALPAVDDYLVEELMVAAKWIVEAGETHIPRIEVLAGAMQAVLDAWLEAELRRRLGVRAATTSLRSSPPAYRALFSYYGGKSRLVDLCRTPSPRMRPRSEAPTPPPSISRCGSRNRRVIRGWADKDRKDRYEARGRPSTARRSS